MSNAVFKLLAAKPKDIPAVSEEKLAALTPVQRVLVKAILRTNSK